VTQGIKQTMTIGRIKKPILIIMTSLTLILGTFALATQYPEAEAAPAIDCPPDIIGGEHTGNIVAKGGSCDIEDGAIINGNIRVAKGASFFCENSIINGNIQARGAANVFIENCVVTGKVSALNLTNTFFMDGSTINGDLTLRGNTSITLFDSTITDKSVCARNTNSAGSSMTYSNNNGCPG